jgi:hypothetical protein
MDTGDKPLKIPTVQAGPLNEGERATLAMWVIDRLARKAAIEPLSEATGEAALYARAIRFVADELARGPDEPKAESGERTTETQPVTFWGGILAGGDPSKTVAMNGGGIAPVPDWPGSMPTRVERRPCGDITLVVAFSTYPRVGEFVSDIRIERPAV